MGPETTNYDYLKQATVCIQQFMSGACPKEKAKPFGDATLRTNIPEISTEIAEFKQSIMDEFSKLSLVLTQFIDAQKTVNDVILGRTKCTSCGSAMKVIGSGESTPEPENMLVNGNSKPFTNGNAFRVTDMKIELATPPMSVAAADIVARRSTEREETQAVAQAIVSRMASTDSVEQTLIERSINSVQSSIACSEDDDVTGEEAGVNPADVIAKLLNKQQNKEYEMEDELNIDKFLQSSLIQDLARQSVKQETVDEPSLEDSMMINNILEKIFGHVDMSGNDTADFSMDTSSIADLTNGFDFSMTESLTGDFDVEPSTSNAPRSRKRKNTPIKVEKEHKYACPMDGCKKIFKEKGSVQRHFVTHIGMRFNCDQCKASYTQKHALMLHQKIHENPEAYQCKNCGTNYTTQNGLRLHKQRHLACAAADMPNVKQEINVFPEQIGQQIGNGFPEQLQLNEQSLPLPLPLNLNPTELNLNF